MVIILSMTSNNQERSRRPERARTREGDRTGLPFQFPPQLPGETDLARSRPAGQGGTENGPGPAAEFEVEGVYIISVAARILDMHPQTLRKYERLGLINPDRTGGMLRLYSRWDIRKILLIRHLMDNLGLNLAGVEFALALVENLGQMRQRVASLPEDNSARKLVDQQITQLCRNLNLPEPGFVPGDTAMQQEKQGPNNDG